MSELKPCKPITREWIEEQEARCAMAAMASIPGADFMNLLQLAKRGLRPQRVADDTPARIRDVRIGLEVAAKAITKEQDRLLTDDDYLMDTKDCCAVMKEITDADIMKEISRE